MSIFSGILVSGDVVFGTQYSKIPESLVLYEGYLISGITVFSDRPYVNNEGGSVFSEGTLINSNIYFGTPYVTEGNKSFAQSIIITPTVRPVASGDTGLLIEVGFYTDFTGSPRIAFVDDPIQFIDYTYGPDIKSWLWNFGDGGTSTERNPVHFYSEAGIYSVSLTVTSINNQQTSLVKTQYITISAKDTGTLKLYPIITNQRISPYKLNTNDKIQIKFQIYKDNAQLSYLNDIPLTLKLNFSGWQVYESGITDRFGSYTFHHLCSEIYDVNNCLTYGVAIINNEVYKSNIIRINFK
jgi:PKD repeat protein